MTSKILVVGENQPLWEDFRATCAGRNSGWEAQFARTGQEALAVFEEGNFQSVVADVQLLDMNGLDLLDRMMEARPETARLVLSDVAEPDSTVKCVGKGHQHLIKQCGAKMILEALSSAAERDAWLPSSAVRDLVSRMKTVPSPPGSYFRIVEEMQSDTVSVEAIGQLISEDPALTAKVLQLANSVVFGLQLQVSQPSEAVAYLGMETTKALVLLVHTFSGKHFKSTSFSVDSLWHHSVFAGRFARQIAQSENTDAVKAEQASAAGLLHDLGKLLFVANLPEEFGKALARAKEQKCSLWEAEREVLGACHAELGACLLGIWGLPKPIIEAVAFHHYPIEATAEGFEPLTAVHAANVLAHEAWPEAPGLVHRDIDPNYINVLGLQHHTDTWRQRCLPARAAAHA